jgi:uncharacterized membrane protein YdcZ (DUF606 family)
MPAGEYIRGAGTGIALFPGLSKTSQNMKRILGAVFLVVGIIMVIWTGFSFTRREKVVDAGPVHISADKEHTVNWPPYAGGILALAGVVLLVLPERKT